MSFARRQGMSILVLSVLAFFSASVQAMSMSTYYFSGITANNINNTLAGQSQLYFTMTDLGGSQVQFDFFNVGSTAMSITDVYFDDGTLLGISQLIDADDGVGGDAGVDFSRGANPGNLPGGSSMTNPFETTAGFLADADTPDVPLKGVNLGETLGVIFDLKAGQTYTDTVAALRQGWGYGGLRVGIHVQAFANGGSESFVNCRPGVPCNPPTNLVEPGTLGMMLMGLAGLGFGRRKRLF
jgi:hypothetical protein